MTSGRIFEIPIASQSKTHMNNNADQIKEIQANKKRLLDEIKALEEQETALTKYKGFKLGDWVYNVTNNFTYQIAGFGECKHDGSIYAESKAGNMADAFYLRALKPATDAQIIKVLKQRAEKAGIVVGARYIDMDYKNTSMNPVREIESIRYGVKKGSLDKKHDSICVNSFLDKNGWVIAVRGTNGHVNSHDLIEIIKEEPLPTINGHTGTYDGEVFTYGCAKIDKSLIKDAYYLATNAHNTNTLYKGNRFISEVQIKLDSEVTLTWDVISQLYKVIQEREKK